MIRRVAAVLVTLIALVAAWRLVAPQDTTGVRRQLAFLRAQLDDGAAQEAQQLFPEGFFFLHALYGLAHVELGRTAADPAEDAREARWALAQLESPAGREPFDAGLTPAYGVFYQGWTNWLRGGVQRLPFLAVLALAVLLGWLPVARRSGPPAAEFDRRAGT